MRLTFLVTLVALALSAVLFESIALAFEDTRVMPKGVRRVEYRNISTNLDEKTNTAGERQSLAQPLKKDLKLNKMIEKRTGFEKTQLEGFLLSMGLSDSDSAGTFTADLQGSVNVQVLTAAYGVTDRLTIGFAVPYYAAQTSAKIGFQENETSKNIVRQLYEQGNITKSREAALQLNAAATSFQDTLSEMGYQEIGEWEDQDLGDVIIRGKYFIGESSFTRMAMTFGLTAPTGRTEDPDILTDINFGDGTWDLSSAVMFDQLLGPYVVINEYARYTYQDRGEKVVRLVTEEDPITDLKGDAEYKLGDKVEFGASARFEAPFGVSLGLGQQWHRKLGDEYQISESQETEAILRRNTDQKSIVREFSLGYSSVSAFRRGEIPVPFATNLQYQRQISSRNLPVTHRIQFDAKVFF